MLPSKTLRELGRLVGFISSQQGCAGIAVAGITRRFSAALPEVAEKPPNITTAYVQEAFEVLDLPNSLYRRIVNPDRELTVELVVTNDKGQVEVYNAHRVQHNNARGPYKGGIMYHPSTNLEDLRSLASVNTWKTALLDVPFGGAKGGVACDPTQMSSRELERLTRKLVQTSKEVLGPLKDIPAPDINTDERVMAWIFDEYSKYHGFSPAVVTGKPVWLHGTYGRDAAAGRGVAIATREFLRHHFHCKVADMSFLIQGFGKLGSWTAQALYDAGGKVVGINDLSGTLYNEDGLDIPAIRRHKASGKPLVEYPGGGALNNEDFFQLPCDILIPAALSGAVTAQAAAQLQCRAIVEGANEALTLAADAELKQRGIPVVPDVLANGGGVVVSFLEWVQNLQNFRWEQDDVLRLLDRHMTDAFKTVWNKHKEEKLPLRLAAYTTAVSRVAQAEIKRGSD